MSATSHASKPLYLQSSRPVIAAPGLQVVPTPATTRGFIGTVVLCATLFLGALAAAFYLNTLMVAGAYELKDIVVEHNEVAARVATLESEVITNTSPHHLRNAAQDLGMVPATDMLYIDVEAGAVSAPQPRND
ncbi:hypothetical protein [Arcanobacterium pinnipediorum]|uniref:Cell division protein FtsL n=1 Tax=Arcanobacterium pinnipediorum TaxID=1503041 RepID=A0ABY5AL97_9ACTO|nr:hypothetical protein [Arcanobacterium pinnipediorum]USR80024.1 hypothetical protein NG665_03350 [Arcanobacterium pinnipediorum]